MVEGESGLKMVQHNLDFSLMVMFQCLMTRVGDLQLAMLHLRLNQNL